MGVAGALSLFVTLNTISEHFSSRLDQTLSGQVDIIVQAKNAGTPFSSYINQSLVSELKTLQGVASVSSFIMASRKVEGSHTLYIFGASDFNPIANRLGLGLVEGRNFTPGRDELLLGQKAARRLGFGVGSHVTLANEQTFLVTGIFSLGIDYLDGGIFLDITQAQQLLNQKKMINLAFITVDSQERIEEVVSGVNERFLKLLAYPSGELSRNIGTLQMVKVLVPAISLVTLIVCSIIILNTLIMAVSERTKEIGILMAIGWPRRMIMMILINESMLISLAAATLFFFSLPSAYPT